MGKTQRPIQIPGYTYGTSAVAKSPLSEQDFDRLKQSIHGFKTYPARLTLPSDWIKQVEINRSVKQPGRVGAALPRFPRSASD